MPSSLRYFPASSGFGAPRQAGEKAQVSNRGGARWCTLPADALGGGQRPCPNCATIPVTLRTVQEQLGVDKSVGSFTVPLGATINMDGTAIMQGVATVFIANVYGVDLTVIDYLTVVVTATLASIGTAAVPGVGLVKIDHSGAPSAARPTECVT